MERRVLWQYSEPARDTWASGQHVEHGIGELGGIRTLDQQIKSPLLYQLSYELP